MYLYRTISVSVAAYSLVQIAHGEQVGRWCDTIIPGMPNMDAFMVLENSDDGSVKLKITHGDGSSRVTNVRKSGSDYLTDNNFGEYYRPSVDGGLSIYDKDGFIRKAKVTTPSAKAGSCR